MMEETWGQPGSNDMRTYEKIRKTATGQGDDYTTTCLLDYAISKKNVWADCNRFK